jgi:hypothetical protein
MTDIGNQKYEEAKPSNLKAEGHKLERGIPLRLQLGLLSVMPPKKSRLKKITRIKARKAVENPSLVETLVSDGEGGTDRHSTRQASQNRLVPKRGSSGDGSNQKSSKHDRQCQYCLLWFSVKGMMRHFQGCKNTAQNRTVLCRFCGVDFQALHIYNHIEVSHSVGSIRPGKSSRAVQKVDESPSGAQIAKPPAQKLEEERVPCKFCEVHIRKSDMERHMKALHSKNGEWRPHGAVRRFSFVLLPPSNDGIRDAIERYRGRSNAHQHSLMEAYFDWERLEQIESLKPMARYVGIKSWKGYVVFEFQDADRVILECPRTGNATYIIEGNWRELIAATKRELREEFPNRVTRIIHNRDWRYQVRTAAFISCRRR